MLQFFRIFWFVALRNKELWILFFSLVVAIILSTYFFLTGEQFNAQISTQLFSRELNLSISILEKITHASAFCVVCLFPFLIQKMETDENANVRYGFLPIRYWQVFTIRFLSSLLFLLAYYLLCNVIFFIEAGIFHSDYPTFSAYELLSTLGDYFIFSLITMVGYMGMIVVLSFFIDNLIIGFALLSIFYGLSFVQIFWFLPFSFTPARLNYLSTLKIFPDSYLASERLIYPEIGSVIFGLLFFFIGMSLNASLIFRNSGSANTSIANEH